MRFNCVNNVCLYFYSFNWKVICTMAVFMELLQKRISFRMVSEVVRLSWIPQVIQSISAASSRMLCSVTYSSVTVWGCALPYSSQGKCLPVKQAASRAALLYEFMSHYHTIISWIENLHSTHFKVVFPFKMSCRCLNLSEKACYERCLDYTCAIFESSKAVIDLCLRKDLSKSISWVGYMEQRPPRWSSNQ